MLTVLFMTQKRRLANAMQDLKVEYDSTVRDASGKIVQFNSPETIAAFEWLVEARDGGGTIKKAMFADVPGAAFVPPPGWDR